MADSGTSEDKRPEAGEQLRNVQGTEKGVSCWRGYGGWCQAAGSLLLPQLRGGHKRASRAREGKGERLDWGIGSELSVGSSGLVVFHWHRGSGTQYKKKSPHWVISSEGEITHRWRGKPLRQEASSTDGD